MITYYAFHQYKRVVQFKQATKSLLSLPRFDLLSSSGLFTKSFSFEEKSKISDAALRISVEQKETECDKLLLLAPLEFGERASGQVGMRSRQGSNSSRGENVNWLDGGEPGNSSEGENVQEAKLCWGSSPGEPARGREPHLSPRQENLGMG